MSSEETILTVLTNNKTLSIVRCGFNILSGDYFISVIIPTYNHKTESVIISVIIRSHACYLTTNMGRCRRRMNITASRTVILVFRKFRPLDHRSVQRTIIQHFRWWSMPKISTTHRPPNCESIATKLIYILMSRRNKTERYSFDNVWQKYCPTLARVLFNV